MNRDPFLRAALIVSLTGFAAALYALFGILHSVVLATVGTFVAVCVSVDTSTAPTVEKPARPERPRTDSEGKPVDFRRVRG